MKHALGSLSFHLVDAAGPYYQQLIDQVKSGISAARLNPGDKLPSSRHLAVSLGVSRSTVARAYDSLLAEGFLVSEPKRGLFVAATARTQGNTPPQVRSALPVEPLPALSCDSGADIAAFPARDWAASMRRSWLNPDHKVLEGVYASGYPPLKEAIADYLFRVRGLTCSPDQVFVTSGNRDALIILQHSLDAQTEQARWLLENPGYTPMRALLSTRALGLGSLQVDSEGVRLPAACESPQVAIITPNRQYPLGITMSPARRQAWLQAMQAPSSLWLIEDDYDNEYLYQGRMGLPLMQADTQGRCFLVGSFSKVLFRGLRLGFVVVPPAQIERFHASQQALGASASLPIQPVLADFMRHGCFDRHLNRMRRHYRLKRDRLLALLAETLTPWLDWQTPNGGMHIRVMVKQGWLAAQPPARWDRRIADDLANNGIHLEVLSDHYATPATGEQGFLLGFSSPSLATMLSVVRALADWFDRQSG
ncbi:PLP-dependent aminotransferase family protein [Saccharospirillum impatiens]|uniref:MocR-like pyridoxine biosynthesis transcription factor PdxR n=1 Tax=Saccharospirillum impatiens TaxID=169438 RepID=UPI000684FF3E|nr:PLP-dependent aminotransferase family protein [Saccharospirillum impatiens]